jgi:hypothetical protein
VVIFNFYILTVICIHDGHSYGSIHRVFLVAVHKNQTNSLFGNQILSVIGSRKLDAILLQFLDEKVPLSVGVNAVCIFVCRDVHVRSNHFAALNVDMNVH